MGQPQRLAGHHVRSTTRFKFAVQQVQNASFAIIHTSPSSLASKSAWKALVLSSWLLLGRPAINAFESNCTFQMHDWSFVGRGLVSGPWYAPNVMLLRCRTQHTERISSSCSHVFAKLLCWRALVAKDEPWQLPETHRQFQSQNKLFKRPVPVRSGRACPYFIPKMPRILGMCADHWNDFGSLAGNSNLFARVSAHIVTGGHRQLVMSFSPQVLEDQTSNTMIKTIQYLSEADTSKWPSRMCLA